MAAVELFKAQITFMAGSPTYTMAQHLVQLQDSAKAAGVTGWKSKLRSTEEQQELENQFAEIKIGEALSVCTQLIAGFRRASRLPSHDPVLAFRDNDKLPCRVMTGAGICAVLQPEELSDPKLIDRRAKLRVGAQLGVDVSKVNKFIHNYEEMQSASAHVALACSSGVASAFMH